MCIVFININVTTTGTTVEEIGIKLTNDCQVVSQWMQGNTLKLNADKTHLMTVGTSRSLQRQEDSLTVYMDNCRLGESEDKCETLLGCQIEPGLKWHKQVSQLILKLKKRLTAPEKLRNVIPQRVQKNLTQRSFTSVLVYCLPSLGD